MAIPEGFAHFALGYYISRLWRCDSTFGAAIQKGFDRPRL